MRKRFISYTSIFLLFLLVLPVSVAAQNYIQSLDGGRIDWTNAVVEASGKGLPPSKPINPSQARAVAKSEAIRKARAELLKIIKGIQVDYRTLIRDLFDQCDGVREAVNGLLANAQVVDLTYSDDGSVEATAAIRLNGSFAEVVLPKSIRTINPVQQPRTKDKKKENHFTGLVIDCRGFAVKAAMVPRIMNEDAQIVYGPAYVSREYAVKLSMAAYARDLPAAQDNPRVVGDPLTVKGIRTAKTGGSDIVISNADAARIRGTASNLGLFQKCRVMIVVD